MKTMSLEQYRLLNAKPGKKKTGTGKAKAQADELKKQVALSLIGFPPYETEYMFHSKRKWRLDYAWPALKVALEVHGGVFTNGRHTRGTGFTNDRVKMNTAALDGWLIIEATTEQVKNGLMRTWIIDAIDRRTTHAPS